jgi:hypothetical protein
MYVLFVLTGATYFIHIFYFYMQHSSMIADHSGRHELSSLARSLGSWVRISLKAWMSVCAFLLCLCCPLCR